MAQGYTQVAMMRSKAKNEKRWVLGVRTYLEWEIMVHVHGDAQILTSVSPLTLSFVFFWRPQPSAGGETPAKGGGEHRGLAWSSAHAAASYGGAERSPYDEANNRSARHVSS